ncbi:MAG: AarF/ABC1/UbiB kinase family protein [Roseiflexaceae bacterium]|nr:AarF/ABC1/UbiB kinase family protein [Roseiflexaceae bacterium]
MWPLVRQARNLGRYRQIAQVLTRYGFGFFLDQIGLASLLSLPRRVLHRTPQIELTGPVRLRLALTELGPTFIKLGQALSTRPDLVSPDYIVELSKLQDAVPPFPTATAIALIEQELGRPLAALFSQFDQPPLAAASLGQVHTATLHDGTAVVVKIQRPGIEATVNTDLAILTDLAALAQERTALGEQYDLVDLAWEFSAALRGELDYRREGRNAERFRANFADFSCAHIPFIYWDFTTSRVLTMERLVGIKINDIAQIDTAGLDRKLLARHATEMILQEIFSDGFFHADPHPGNLFAMPNNVIGAVDFGQVVILDRDLTRNLLLLLFAISERDVSGMLRSMQRLDILTPRELTPSIRRDASRFIDRFVDQSLEELSARETINELFALVQRHRLRMPAPLALLLKALVMMEGIGVLLDAQLDVFKIARPYTEQALRELAAPERLAREVLAEGRELGEIALNLPRQVSTTLQRINDGEISVTAHIPEGHQIAAALMQASIRLSLALVLASFVLGIALLGVAIALGLGGGTLALFGTLAGAAVLFVGVALIISFLRRGLG